MWVLQVYNLPRDHSIDQVASFWIQSSPGGWQSMATKNPGSTHQLRLVVEVPLFIYDRFFFKHPRCLGMGFLNHHFRSMLMYLLEFGARIFRSSDWFLRRHQPSRTRSKMPLSVSTISVSNHVAVVVVLAYPRCFTRKKTAKSPTRGP